MDSRISRFNMFFWSSIRPSHVLASIQAGDSDLVCGRNERPHRHILLLGDLELILQKLPYLLDQRRSLVFCHFFQPWCQERPFPSFLSQAIHHRFRLLLSFRHVLPIVDRTSRIASGTRYREFHAPKPQTGGQVAYHWVVIPTSGLNFSCRARFNISSQSTSSNTINIPVSS